MTETHVEVRIHDAARGSTLIYLPGLHGDWTLAGGFRSALSGRAAFVEFTYPRVTSWSLEDYARNIFEVLRQRGITQGWVIGESFGSQIAWQLTRQPGFKADGLILAGGFVRHPAPWGVPLAGWISAWIPMAIVRTLVRTYARYVCFCQRQRPEAAAEINEFVVRRSDPLDRLAITARYRLLMETDLRAVARATRLPVYFISGFFDPIVPWPWVRRWLASNCPGFRGSKIVPAADHIVLATAPEASADEILRWTE